MSSLFQLIKEDWATNGRDSSRPGFRALLVYRFGVWRMGIGSRLIRMPLSAIYHFLFRRVRNGYGIEIPHTVKIGRRLAIEHQGAIVLHGDTVIGDDCIIRQGVTMGNRYLDRPNEAPILHDGVNVGAGAKVLGRVNIGDGAVIGANAVVLKDVESHSTVVGIPARRI